MPCGCAGSTQKVSQRREAAQPRRSATQVSNPQQEQGYFWNGPTRAAKNPQTRTSRRA